MNILKSNTKLFTSSESLNFALNLKKWELENLPEFMSSSLGQRFFLILANSRCSGSKLSLKNLYIDSMASAAGVRKRIVDYTEGGFITIVPNIHDSRSRNVEIKPKFDDLLIEYNNSVNRFCSLYLTQVEKL